MNDYCFLAAACDQVPQQPCPAAARRFLLQAAKPEELMAFLQASCGWGPVAGGLLFAMSEKNVATRGPHFEKSHGSPGKKRDSAGQKKKEKNTLYSSNHLADLMSVPPLCATQLVVRRGSPCCGAWPRHPAWAWRTSAAAG